MKNKITILIILLCIGVMFSGCIKKQVEEENPPVNEDQNEEKKLNFKIFRDENLGIEFRYPSTWEVSKDEYGRISLVDLSSIGMFNEKYDNMTINEKYEEIRCGKNDELTVECKENKSLNNATYVWKIEKTKGGHDYVVYIATGKKIIRFNFQEKENYEKRADEYQTLLQSLKIIE